MRSIPPVRALLATLLLVAAAAPAGAQEASDRPTVGLVLSGGGARGIAHIGVLEVLEELRVPVDVVTGTSMGALVGGLYAAGVPVDSIRGIVSSADWDALLADTPVRATLDFPPRARNRRYTIEIEAGLSREEVILPGGLIAGQELGLLLRRATAPVAAVEDFRELPIPYAAVATDIAAFERVVLDDGDLVEAMRASMAIPVAIAPVEIEGRLLVDGGLVDDLPVQLAREMGADVVIAVDVTPSLLERDELSGLLDIAQQIVRGLGRIGVDAERESADVAIVPELDGVSVFDFRRSEEIRERGARATRAAADSLRRWTLSPEAYAGRIVARAERVPVLPRAFAEVRLSAPGIDERLVRARMDRDLIRAFDPALAERLARRVYATGLFERVGWDIDPRGPDLVIDPRLHPHGPHLLLGGLDLVLDSAGESPPRASFELVLGYLRTRIGARAAEWGVDLRLGTRAGIETVFRQPLDFGGRWFVEPSAALLRLERPVYEGGRSEAEYETGLAGLGLDAGRTLGSWAEARVGLYAERSISEFDSPAEAASDRFPDEAETTVELRGAIVVDRLDAVGIPRRGVYVQAATRASREALGAERDWATLTLDARVYGSLGPHTWFARAAAGGSSPARDLPAREEYLLGGFGSLNGYADGELRGEAFGMARTGWLIQLSELPPAFRAIMAGGWVDVGDTWDPSIDEDPRARLTVTASVGVETLLGPAFLAWTPAGGESRVALSLGRSP